MSVRDLIARLRKLRFTRPDYRGELETNELLDAAIAALERKRP